MKCGLTVVSDETWTASVRARQKVNQLLHRFGEQLLQQRIRRANLPPSFVRPLVTHQENIASPVKTNRHILADLLPTLIMLMVLLGAFYPAIDLTAGEKERGTLETLLVAPVPAARFNDRKVCYCGTNRCADRKS